MDRKVEANRKRREEHRRNLKKLPVIDRRPYIKLHDEAVVDTSCYESSEIELE